MKFTFLFLILISEFQTQANAINTSELDLGTGIVQSLNELFPLQCEAPVDLNGAELAIYNCVRKDTNESLSFALAERQGAGFSGITIQYPLYLNTPISEEALLKFTKRLALAGLIYFQSIDSRTTWEGKILKEGLLLKGDMKFTTYFQQEDQTSAAFVETGFDHNHFLQIFIGWAG